MVTAWFKRPCRGFLSLRQRSVGSLGSGRVIAASFSAISAGIYATTQALTKGGPHWVPYTVTGWQRRLAVGNYGCRFTSFSFESELTNFKIGSFCRMTVFPGIRSILFLTFRDSAKAIRLYRTRAIMYFRAWRSFCFAALFVDIKFNTSGRYFRYYSLKIRSFFLGSFDRTSYVTKSYVRNDDLRIISRLSLTFTVSNYHESY